MEKLASSYKTFKNASEMISNYYMLNENNDQLIEKKNNLLKIVNSNLKRKLLNFKINLMNIKYQRIEKNIRFGQILFLQINIELHLDKKA